MTYRLGRHRTMTVAHFASGALLIAMGRWAIASSGNDGMRAGSGWQADLALWVSGIGRRVTRSMDWVPWWVAAASLVILAVWTIRRAIRQLTSAGPTPAESPTTELVDQEESVVTAN